MAVKDYLIKEIRSSEEWLVRSLEKSAIPWKESPENVKTNINWLIGHLTISTYFHGVLCIHGSDESIKKAMDLKQYSTWYGMNSRAQVDLDLKWDNRRMLQNMKLVNVRVLQGLEKLSEEDLWKETVVKNPIARDKYESLSWTVKHRMWHAGQLALINSISNG